MQSNCERLPRKTYCPGRYVVAGLGGSCGGVRLVPVAGESWDCYFGALALRSRGRRLCLVLVVGHDAVVEDARRLKRKSSDKARLRGCYSLVGLPIVGDLRYEVAVTTLWLVAECYSAGSVV